jgi:hypothetical protein
MPPSNFCRSLIFLLLPGTCLAQLRWRAVDSLFAPLPSSLRVYRTTDSLDDAPFLAYFVSAKLEDKNLVFTARALPEGRLSPAAFYTRENNPLLVVNCSFFSFESGQNLSLVVADGKIAAYNICSLPGRSVDSGMYYYPTRSALGISRKRKADLAWVFADSTHRWPYAFEEGPVVAKGKEPVPGILDLDDVDWKWWRMRTAVGGGPTLVHNGEIRISSREEQMFAGEEMEKQPRTAIGYTHDNRLIILVIQGRLRGKAEGANLLQEARVLKDLGCFNAMNLNGGGSSCLLINGKETIRPSDPAGERPVPAVFLIQRAGGKKARTH